MLAIKILAIVVTLLIAQGTFTSYRGAVIEHGAIYDESQTDIVTADQAISYMNANLDILEPLVKQASQDHVQILIFPEDALTGFLNCNR